MKGIYHITPLYESFVWGGKKLVEEFGLDPSWENVGTIYAVIAVPEHLDNIVKETNEPLSKFYKTHPEVFGSKKVDFPIRMTITCNEGFQSFQSHPDDEYALKHEGKMGKVSGSVVLKESDHVVLHKFGHKAQTIEEFQSLIEKKDWDSLFDQVKVKDGDFLHTPAGVIHGGYGDGNIYAAIGTNGDVTYRFYDLDRNDPNRPLHIQQVIDCVTMPEMDLSSCVKHPKEKMSKDLIELEYYNQPGEYIAKRLKVRGHASYEQEEFYFIVNVEGEGSVNGEILPKGHTVLVPQGFGSITLEGEMDLMLTSYRD